MERSEDSREDIVETFSMRKDSYLASVFDIVSDSGEG